MKVELLHLDTMIKPSHISEAVTAMRGCPVYYPGIHHCKRGEVSSNSAIVKTTKFTGPGKSRMRQYIINACFTRRSRRGP
jgi:hypothetical protein